MKSLILELIIIVLISSFSQSITMKNLHYIYSGASKLGYVNSKIIVECPAKAQFYLWKFYQMQLEPQVLLQQEGKFLTIDPATVDKSGIYECKSTTGFTNTDTNITVKIIDPISELVAKSCSNSMSPQIRDVSKGICFYNDKTSKLQPKIGDNVEMDCTAAGVNLKYFWNFIGNNQMKSQIQMEHNISKIIIKTILPENEGVYKCEVANIYGEKISRTFNVALTEMTPNANMEIIGRKQDDLLTNVGQQVILKCEVKSKYHRIHSIKWGIRIKNMASESISKSNIVSWDQFNYNLLPEIDIKKKVITQNHIENLLTLSIRDNDQSGIYICHAMDATGRTAHKIFNITISSEDQFVEASSKNYYFLLYILLPVILIFALVCAIIYCCVKSSSKNSHNSVPLKKFNSTNPNNSNKEPISNYYYPVSNNRPPLPQPNESQVSLASPNTLTSYSSYGNYHMPSTNQPSCCSSNGV